MQNPYNPHRPCLPDSHTHPSFLFLSHTRINPKTIFCICHLQCEIPIILTVLVRLTFKEFRLNQPAQPPSFFALQPRGYTLAELPPEREEGDEGGDEEENLDGEEEEES